MKELGILTLACRDDYRKAIGLALSLRRTNPGLPIAIACAPALVPEVEPFFDTIVEERDGLRGFQHKLFLDEYSPFARTLFLDADVLVFRDLGPVLESWKGRPYTARGSYFEEGFSSFGLDRRLVLSRIGKPRLVVIGGAGHAYFEKPGCSAVFEKGREIMQNYAAYANPCRFADEDVMGIAMTLLGLEPMPNNGFHARVSHSQAGTWEMDAVRGICRFQDKRTQELVEPTVVHFANLEAPFLYHRELERLISSSGGPRRVWWRIDALSERATKEWWRLKDGIRATLGRKRPASGRSRV